MRGPVRPAPSWAKPCPTGHPFRSDAAAVTPLIGTVLILGIAVAGLAIVMTWGLPAMQQTQAEAELAGLLHQFENLEELAENVVRSGGIGKANEATLSFTDGQVSMVDGTLFVLSLHAHDTAIAETERFWVEVERETTRYHVTVHPGEQAATTGRWVEAHAVTSAGAINLQTLGWDFYVDLEDLTEGSLRVRVVTDVSGEDIVIMEAWVLSSGGLEYIRQAPFGEVRLHLEFGSVMASYETGSHIHSQPLARLETTDRGAGPEPAFLGFFAQLFVPDPLNPGIESAGPGGHPIRIALQENVLRVGGSDVREVGIQAVGVRAALWEEMYMERYGFIPAAEGLAPGGESLYLDGTPGVVLAMGEESFQFVLMESRIELSMLQGMVRLDG